MRAKITRWGLYVWALGAALCVFYQWQWVVVKASVIHGYPSISFSTYDDQKKFWNYLENNKNSEIALTPLKLSDLKQQVQIVYEPRKEKPFFVLSSRHAKEAEKVLSSIAGLGVQYIREIINQEKGKLEQKNTELETSLDHQEQELLTFQKENTPLASPHELKEKIRELTTLLEEKEEEHRKLNSTEETLKTMEKEGNFSLVYFNSDLPIIKKYKEIENSYISLKNRYTEKHLKMINLKSELAGLKKVIFREIEEQNKLLQKQMGTLQASIEKNQKESLLLTSLKLLQENISRTKKTHEETLLNLEKLTRVSENHISYDLKIENNLPAVQKSLAYFGMGLIIFLSLIGVASLLDKRIYSPSHIYKAHKDIPLLAVTPKISEKEESLPLVLHRKPQSMYSKSVLHIRNRLLAMTHRPCQIILMTSMGEKSEADMLVSNLAIALAQVQKQVLLIDCEFQTPIQHKYFKLQNKGLAQVLQGECLWKDMALRVEVPNLMILPAGQDLRLKSLYSSHFSDLLKRCEQHYEFIFLNAPSLSLGKEAILMAQHRTDGVIISLPLGQIERETLKWAKEELLRAGVSLLGVVLQDADVPKARKWNELYSSSNGGANILI